MRGGDKGSRPKKMYGERLGVSDHCVCNIASHCISSHCAILHTQWSEQCVILIIVCAISLITVCAISHNETRYNEKRYCASRCDSHCVRHRTLGFSSLCVHYCTRPHSLRATQPHSLCAIPHTTLLIVCSHGVQHRTLGFSSHGMHYRTQLFCKRAL